MVQTGREESKYTLLQLYPNLTAGGACDVGQEMSEQD